MTDFTNLAELESIAGQITKTIKQSGIAFNVCDVQSAVTPSPKVFGVRKAVGTTDFEIVTQTPEVPTETASSGGFTQEVAEDIFALFGLDAVEVLRGIALNDLVDKVDFVVLNYMYLKAASAGDLTLDFSVTTDYKTLVSDLIIKISAVRTEMSGDIRRGLPRVLVVTAGVAALLLANNLITGTEDRIENVQTARGKSKDLGHLGDMHVYVDYDSTRALAGEYVLVTHKSDIVGDAAMMILPINDIQTNVLRDEDSGQIKLHYKQRYTYSQNPLATAGDGASDFMRKFDVTLTGFDAL
jgi:hypothetical protein